MPASTYDMILRGAAIDPDAPALSFFLSGDAYRHVERWSYREFVRDINRTANMFLRMGDLGCRDADGYFWLTGRKKELTIRGGHNIDPAAIEGPLHAHPAVQIAAAVGRPDAQAGELPVAYVQLKFGVSTTEEELVLFAREHIGERAAVPKHIRIIEAMPLTGVGKIFKPELKRREMHDALEAALAEAGIVVDFIDVGEDKSRGSAATVKLQDPARTEEARAIPGKFPFAVSMAGPASPRRRRKKRSTEATERSHFK